MKKNNNILHLMGSFCSLLIFLAISCKSYNSPTQPPPGGGPGPNEIWMQGNFSFNPSNLTIQKGTTITWINKDTVAHTATSGNNGNPNGIFDSGTLNTNGRYSFTFNNAGTFPYYCKFHFQMGMVGTITVQ